MQFFAYAVNVGAGPVDPTAAWAAREMVLRGKDVGWNLVSDVSLERRHHSCVTPSAPREEGGEWIEATSVDDLTELLADVIALDEDERQTRCGAQQLVVAREDGSLFGAGQAHETPP